MSKAVAEIAVGVAVVAGAILAGPAFGALIGTTLMTSLISAGASLTLSGVGTLLSKGPLVGMSGNIRNPISPWVVVYGRAKVGGTIIFILETGESDKYLHLVLVLACHPCQSIDALLFDNMRVTLDNSGNSLSYVDSTSVIASNRTANISSITRVDDVVTVVLSSAFAALASSSATPPLMDGDQIEIHDVSGDATLNGLFNVSVINSTTFTYISGGSEITVAGSGHATTTLPDYGDTVHMEVALGTQTSSSPPFPGLLASGDTGSQGFWTNEHVVQGRTAVYLRLKYGGNTYASGMPNIAFLVHGKNDIYDPRTSPPSHAYSENPALCIADYLAQTTWGFKAVYGTEIPLTPLISAANICDESVSLANGSTEPRYACNGQFPLTTKRGEVLQNLLTSCGGRLTYTGGQFIIHPAAWVGPTLMLGDSDSGVPSGFPVTTAETSLANAAGPFQWHSKVGVRDLYNGVKGTYVSPVNGWQSSDFPAYAQDQMHGYSNGPAMYQYDANLAADGGDRRWLDTQLPFTISVAMAQRLAKIELLRRRYQGNGTFAFNLAMYQLTALDVVAFTLPVLGWNAKLLEVTAHRFTVAKAEEAILLGTELDLTETDPSVYEWSTSEELSPQGFSQGVLPDPSTVTSPTAVTATSNATTAIVGADGIARSRILVTWTPPSDGYVTNGGSIELQFQPYTSPVSSTWTALPSVTPTVTQAYIDSVTDGQQYMIQVRAVNAAGSSSAWVQAGPVTVSGTASTVSPGIIAADGATSGQVLTWNGTTWVPQTTTTFKTNGANNSNQSVLNLAAGTNITLAESAGSVTITAATQVNSDWNAVSGVPQILNKPTLGTAAAQNTAALTESTSAVLAITDGSAAVLGSGTSIEVKKASASQAGYLSAADWSTFNSTWALWTGDVDANSHNLSNVFILAAAGLQVSAFCSFIATTVTYYDGASTFMTSNNAGGGAWNEFSYYLQKGATVADDQFWFSVNARATSGDPDSWSPAIKLQGLTGEVVFPNAVSFGTPESISFGSDWQSWTLTVAGGGSMTISGLTVTFAEYIRVGKFVSVHFYCSFTPAGSAATSVTVSLPVAVAALGGVCAVSVSGSVTVAGQSWVPLAAFVNPGTSTLTVYAGGSSATNFQTGSTATLSGSFTYRC